MKIIKQALFFIFPLLLSSCGNDGLPDYFLLDRLRVLATTNSVAASEFSAGDSVTLSFHISDPKGAGRTLSYSVQACVDPGISIGLTPTCAGNPTATTAITGSLVPGSAATNYYGVLTPPAFTVPAAGIVFINPLTGTARSAADQYNGVAYLVVMTLTASTTESVTAFKRIIVSTKTTKNQNPTFSSPELLFAGASAASYTLTTDALTIAAQVSTSSSESYSAQNADGSFTASTEKLTLTWLVSSGKMRLSRSDLGVDNRFTPESPLPAVTSFIAVLRDDRGGSAVFSINK